MSDQPTSFRFDVDTLRMIDEMAAELNLTRVQMIRVMTRERYGKREVAKRKANR